VGPLAQAVLVGPKETVRATQHCWREATCFPAVNACLARGRPEPGGAKALVGAEATPGSLGAGQVVCLAVQPVAAPGLDLNQERVNAASYSKDRTGYITDRPGLRNGARVPSRRAVIPSQSAGTARAGWPLPPAIAGH